VHTDLHSLKIDRSMKTSASSQSTGIGRRWMLGGGVGLLVLIAIVVFWIAKHGAPPIEVDVIRIAAPSASDANSSAGSSQQVVLDATGYIVAAHRIALAPKVNGRVAWIGVEMGDKVKAKQVLVRLEDDEYRARVLQEQGQYDSAKARLAELEAGSRPEELARAAAELNQAQAELENARVNVERTRQMKGTNAVSAQTIDDAEAKFRTATAHVASVQADYDLAKAGPRKEQIDAQRAVVEQMQGSLDTAKVDLDNTSIRAPVDGTILDRNVEVGEFVTTGFVGEGGAKGYVVSLADLNDLRVELDIGQSDFPKVALGQHCAVTTDAYPDRKYDGVVEIFSPQANRQKATVLTKVKVLNPDDLLRPDMNASVAFYRVAGSGATGAAAGVAPIVVPASAVRDGKVFVVEEGNAILRAVEVGAKTTSGIIIVHGVSIGDEVIVNPPSELKSGQAVKAKT
jgi:HlyD family secretion protein